METVTIESVEKKVMPGDLLSIEETMKLTGQANEALLNDDVDKALEIIGMFTIDKEMKDIIQEAIGENAVQYFVDRGIVFGDV